MKPIQGPDVRSAPGPGCNLFRHWPNVSITKSVVGEPVVIVVTVDLRNGIEIGF